MAGRQVGSLSILSLLAWVLRSVTILALVVALWPVMAGHAATAAAAANAQPVAMAGHHAMAKFGNPSATTDGRPGTVSPGSDVPGAMTCKMHCIGASVLPQPSRATGPGLPLAARLHLVEAPWPPSHAGFPPRRPPKAAG